jgi:uncharacterized integral membrane protein
MKILKNPKIVEYLKDIMDFAIQVGKKLVFWIFLLLDLVSVIVQYFYSKFRLPQIFYILFALTGFLCASFLVFKDLLEKYRTEFKKSETISNPHIKITLVEGNEYSFKINSPYESGEAKLFIYELEANKEQEFHYDDEVLYVEGKPQYWLPEINLILNIKIENDGNIPFDILAILLNYNSKLFSPLQFFSNSIQINSKDISYPFHIEPASISLLQLKYNLSPAVFEVVTVAQIAATIKKLNKILPITIKVDTLNELGERKVYPTEFSISFNPLVDNFKNHCQQFHQIDLLRLMEIGKS